MGFWLPRVGAYLVCVLLILVLAARDDLGLFWSLFVLALSYLLALLASQMIAQLTFPLRWKAETTEFTFGNPGDEPMVRPKWSVFILVMSGPLFLVHIFAISSLFRG